MLPLKDNGVVDPWLSVYGTQNVRVVDLSVAPIHVASHTQSVACEWCRRLSRVQESSPEN